MVGKSFVRNRCLIRASALAYTTLLALIPMLAVGASIAVAFLQKDGEKTIGPMIDQIVAYIAPALDLQVKGDGVEAAAGRHEVVAKITGFINNISGGALGGTSMVALIFVAIQMLRTIEATFNDIWGVTRGRGWIASITQYFTVIALGPLILALAIGITTGPHFTKTLGLVTHHPALSAVFFSMMPFFLLTTGFALFYAFMPNTRVTFSAALAGGLVAGFLWQVNSLLNTMYASNVVTYSKIYGSLSLVPLFLLGIYFSWLFLLFGAQVAYAYQNRSTYLQEKQAEGVNQQGREFVALRIMAFVAQRFARGEPAPTASEISTALGVPSRLASILLGQLTQARLVVEVAGNEISFIPARPLDQIHCGDILQVLRTVNGVSMNTRDEPMRQLVSGELDRVRQAEADIARSITLQKLADLK
ncbi:MAG: YhjD/YihY/BrkB family envelope integrity protein [Verrucomicrobiota bacterium]